jgi:hypothetical protein
VKTLIAFLLLISVPQALATRRAPCGDALYKRDYWQAQVIPIDSGERCFLKMSPQNPKSRYRSYNFSSDGQMMIFVSQGPNTSQTAAQTYYVWPMKDIPRISKQNSSEKVNEVKSAAGDIWVFNKLNEDLVSVKGCEVIHKKVFDWHSESGVEIKKCEGRLLVDAGYTHGKQSTELPEHIVKIRDPAGLACTLKNNDLIDYSKGSNHPKPRFESNLEVYEFLSKHPECQKLNLAVLLK